MKCTAGVGFLFFVLVGGLIVCTVWFLDATGTTAVSDSISKFIENQGTGTTEKTQLGVSWRRVKTTPSRNTVDQLFDNGYRITVFKRTVNGSEVGKWSTAANYYKQGLLLIGW